MIGVGDFPPTSRLPAQWALAEQLRISRASLREATLVLEALGYVDLERRVPADHPLRIIRAVVNAALSELPGAFGPLYARLGRPSIASEKLLRPLLLQAFYSIRSERQLVERLEFDLLFRWFVGLGRAPTCTPSTATGSIFIR